MINELKNSSLIKVRLLYTFLIIIIPIILNQKNINRKLEIENLEITIKINGTGKQEIVHNLFSSFINEVYINGQSITFENNKINILDNNIITIKFANDIQTCDNMFYDMANLIEVDLSNFNSNNIISTKEMFYNCFNLKKINLSDKFNASSVISMYRMFYNCISLESLDLSNFNTLSVKNMDYMFYNCKLLTSLNLSNFDTSSVTSMKFMFCNCSSLTSLDLSKFITFSVQYMQNMFQYCKSLKYLDISNFDTSSIRSIENMFHECNSLISLNLSNFNTSNIKNMNKLFSGCYSLEYLDLSSFNTSSSYNFELMFCNCKSLKSLDLSNFITSEASSMILMFGGCTNLKHLNISNFNTSKVTSMNKMFQGCSSITSLDISNFNTSLVTDMGSMFEGCTLLESLDISKFNTSLVNNIINMFNGCENLKYLDFSKFKTSQVNNMKNMFYNCINLKNLDLSNFNTSKVNNMENMFYNCTSLVTLNISNFDTSEVSYMENMFFNCIGLTSLNISNFHTSNAIFMENMFYNCSALSFLDISNFDTSKVINMNNMFYSCISLTSLNLSNFDTSSVISMSSIFENCINLEYLNFYSLISNETTIINNIFKGTPDEFIYCINNETNAKNIIEQLETKICKYKDCSYDWNENKLNRLEEKKNSIEIFNDKCIFKYIKYISNGFILTDRIPNITIYSYEINSDINELKNKNSNLTYVYFTEYIINNLISLYNLEDNERIYILLIDYPSNDSNTATSDYDYKLILENGTELNISKINEVFYIDISVPIRDFNLSKFEYVFLFSEQGYDIYNKSSDFYKDVCTPAYIGKNDITLKDRKNDIYPNNVTLCKRSCNYMGVDIEHKSIICQCKLNNINNFIYSYDDNDLLIEEDNDNFLSYFLDNINYKIFKCYKLLFVFDNLIRNIAFYTILIILLIIIIINLYLFINGKSNIRTLMFKEMTSDQKLIKEITAKISNKKLLSNENNKTNPIKKSKKNSIIFKGRSKSINISNILFQKKKKSKKFSKINFNLINSNVTKTSKNNNLYGSEFNNSLNIFKNGKKIKKYETINKIDNINDLPYTLAIKKDKRNVIQMFKSIIFEKIDLIYLFIGNEKVKVIVICQYILSSLIGFFFNTLLYSDNVVSHKYHNNGKLDYIVTITLSLLSNIITSIISYYINFSKGVEQRLDEIIEIKREYFYLNALNRYLKTFKIKILFFFISQILIICFCFYYIIIFSIVYNYSQVSLLYNYFSSLIEGIITSILISVIIVITRKVSIVFLNQYLYNTSKYINSRF